MTDHGLISVIVPVYGVEKYLERCIESVLAQSFRNFELILVDDGSKDRCPEICDEWQKKDARIKVLHKDNGGLSDARNAGYEAAAGAYIAFVDSDDWISPYYLETLFRYIKEYKCDIVECGFISTNRILQEDASKEEAFRRFEPQAALELLIRDQVFKQVVWNKLYRREVIGNTLFRKGKINEDEFWTYRVFGNAGVVGKVDKNLYYYFQRDDSIMGNAYSSRRLDAVEAKYERQLYIEKTYPELRNIALTNLWTSMIYQGQMTAHYLKGEELQKTRTRLDLYRRKSDHISWKNCSCNRFSEKLWVTMANGNFWLTCKVKNALKKGLD